MAINPLPSGLINPTQPGSALFSLSGTVNAASGGNLAEVTRDYQDLMCTYSAVTVVGDEFPQLTWPYNQSISGYGRGGLLVDLYYNVTRTIENLPIPIGGGVELRVPHELSAGSYTSTTGMGTGGVITTVQPGIKQRITNPRDEEHSISRNFGQVLITPDPTANNVELREQEHILKWFMYRLIPQIIVMGGTKQDLGIGTISEIASYRFDAFYSPTNNIYGKIPVPDCGEFKLQLMKV